MSATADIVRVVDRSETRGLELPVWLTTPTAPGVYVCREANWHEGAAAIVVDDQEYLWNVPTDLGAGDVIVTVLDCEPPLLACIERIDSVVAGVPSVSRFVPAVPTPWRRLDEPQRTSRQPDGPLEHLPGTALLDVIRSSLTQPAGILVDVGGCADASSAFHVASVLAVGDWRAQRCAICEEPLHPSDAVAHLPEARARVDLRGATEALLLCPPCDELLHQPTVSALRNRMRPACPRCEVRDYVVPILWGMQPGPPQDDESVVGGCLVPDAPPRWMCRNCGSAILVALTHEDTGTPMEVAASSRPVPQRRRDRPLLNFADLARAVGRAPRPLDVGDALSQHADDDVVLTNVNDAGFEMQIYGLGAHLRYPFTLAELWVALDAIAADRDDVADPPLRQA